MIRVLVVVLAAITAAVAPAGAAARKILVLPVDGTADAAIRAKLTAQIVKLARSLDGQVTTADATFADTALAVGCAPRAADCSDQVIATLGVDELVWGTATRDVGGTRFVVRRSRKGSPLREVSTTVDRVDADLTPLFAPALEPGALPAAAAEPARPDPAAIAAAAPPGPAAGSTDHRDRNLGIALTATGGAALALGLALWASYASLQDSIDDHPTRDRDDFDDLRALEDRASSRAIAGDILVAAGLAAGGLGAYYLVRNGRRPRVAIAPAPFAHGGGVTLTLVGGL